MTITAPAPSRTFRGATADAALHARYAATRSPALRDRLVRRYLPLARFCANQYQRGDETFDDLVQIASIGLIKALDRFEPARGVAFSSYALPTMHGELRRHFRDRGWNVRPPRDLLENALRVERVTTSLSSQLQCAPTVGAIAQATGLTDEEVLDARHALGARHGVSLSTPLGGGDDQVLADVIGCDDTGFEAAEQRAGIAGLTRHLSHREREILRLRFEEDLTQAEIGALMGLSQMHISRLLQATLEKLRGLVEAGAIPPC